MKAKSFLQFISESAEPTEGPVQRWLEANLPDGRYSEYLPASPFGGIWDQFAKLLARHFPALEDYLDVDRVSVHGAKSKDGEWTWWCQANWNWDPKEAREAGFTGESQLANISRIPLSEIDYPEEALEWLQYQLLKSAAQGQNLPPEWFQAILNSDRVVLAVTVLENPTVTAEQLIQIVDRFPQLKERAQENPEWPEDLTDWALGDW
jgi:hypothetical protein